MFNWLSKVSTDAIQIVGIVVFIGLFVFILEMVKIDRDVVFPKLNSEQKTAVFQIKKLELMIEEYYMKNGVLPSDLSEVLTNNTQRVDPWGSHYFYNRTHNSYVLTTYGSDREKGGIADAFDITNENIKFLTR